MRDKPLTTELTQSKISFVYKGTDDEIVPEIVGYLVGKYKKPKKNEVENVTFYGKNGQSFESWILGSPEDCIQNCLTGKEDERICIKDLREAENLLIRKFTYNAKISSKHKYTWRILVVDKYPKGFLFSWVQVLKLRRYVVINDALKRELGIKTEESK